MKRQASLVNGEWLIPLTQGYVAIVDEVDSDLAHELWLARPNQYGGVYAARREKGTRLAPRAWHVLHLDIADRMGINDESLEIDHVDRNTLNCKRTNLRAATHAQNMRNRTKQSNNKSGRKGVSRSKSNNGKWHAQITVDGRNIHLGYFSDLDLAAFVYAEAAVKYHGEFARAA